MKKAKLAKSLPSNKPKTHVQAAKNASIKPWQFHLLAITAISVLGVLIYSNSFNCAFHLDDFTSIKYNKNIH